MDLLETAERVIESVAGLEPGARVAVLMAVADLVEEFISVPLDPNRPRLPDARAAPASAPIVTVVNRLREAAGTEKGR